MHHGGCDSAKLQDDKSPKPTTGELKNGVEGARTVGMDEEGDGPLLNNLQTEVERL
jgi:hypothetical protein